MKHPYLTNLPLEQANKNYQDFLTERGLVYRTETIPVQEALGRVSACAVYAKCSAPHYNACAMDGIAIKAALSFGAGETTPLTLGEGQFVRVDTGDVLPAGCDAVIMIEDCVEKDGAILLYAPAVPWQHVKEPCC